MPGIRFSVVIAFYNHEPFVDDAIGSILSQRDETVEVIAVDDGSGDATGELLRGYGTTVKSIVHTENRGASAARNAGAAAASGDYLVFLDGDDVFLPWAIDVYETVARATRPVLIIAGMSWFQGALPKPGARPRSVQFVEYADYFSKDRSFGASASAMVIERSAFVRSGGWQNFPVDDFDLLWKLGTAGRVVQIGDPPTTFHRAHGEQTTLQTAVMLDGIAGLVRHERQGRYPGGSERRRERQACVGGVVLYWSQLAVRRGLYRKGFGFLLGNITLVVAALAARGRARLQGRRRPQTIELPASANRS